MSRANLWHLAKDYFVGLGLDHIGDRVALERHQNARLAWILEFAATHSPFYRSFRGLPHAAWPIIDKSIWMGQFDSINTVGAQLQEVERLAYASERGREFSSTWHGLTVGLSTGTSGGRGIFIASERERIRWAGAVMAKMFGRSLFRRRERIALLLRAGSPLYKTVGSFHLDFRFFDLAAQWDSLTEALHAYSPTLLVAPPSVLTLLSQLPVSLRPKPRRIVSVAEVLDEKDRLRFEAVFGHQIEQIYQATEGFLGVSCRFGSVHLNEEYLIVEKEWCGSEHRRFVPIITDLFRTTQPVIRYRLNDVLRIRPDACPCGRAAVALEAIEGRLDDLLWLPRLGGEKPVAVFPDLLSRAVVAATDEILDYEIQEMTKQQLWKVGSRPLLSQEEQERVRAAISAVAARLGAVSPALQFGPLEERSLLKKFRRIRAMSGIEQCVS